MNKTMIKINGNVIKKLKEYISTQKEINYLNKLKVSLCKLM
jgi:hypothetical protein